MDELTRDMKNIKVTEITCHWHVDEYDYSFTTDIKLATGYPVKDNGSDKIVLVVGEDGVTDMTGDDIQLAIQHGFEVGVAW